MNTKRSSGYVDPVLGAEPSPRTRVVRIIDRLNIGGPAKHVVWLTSEYPDDFEAVLITGTVPPGEGDMSYYAHAVGIEPIVISEMSREMSLRDVVVLAKLVFQFWKLKPQIIDTHKAKAGALGRVAAMTYKWMTPSALWLRPRKCYVVHTYHGHIFHSYYGPLKTRLFIGIERALARFCTDRIIAVSEQQRWEICERFGVGKSEQFRVIPYGIDLDELVECGGRLRKEFEIAGDEIVIGIVGRLCEVKNHAMLLESAAELVKTSEPSHSQVSFVVIGDGHLRGELERQSRELGINDRVAFTGFRDDTTSLYTDLDIVALTSLNEGMPLTLIEALCCARPLAATEVGGVVDLMGERRESRDGFTIWDHGVTAPSRDARAFARALQFLISHPELRREMGERGSAFARARLSKDRCLSDTEQVYRELVPNTARVRLISQPGPLVSFRGKGNSL